jgi:hypothetical protein
MINNIQLEVFLRDIDQIYEGPFTLSASRSGKMSTLSIRYCTSTNLYLTNFGQKKSPKIRHGVLCPGDF